MRVAILFDDVERRPSATPDEAGVLEAVAGCEDALRTLGHEPVRVPARAEVTEWRRALERLAPHLVLNLCEGLGGRSEGEVTAAWVLERLGLPFTGSGPETLELARRKDRVNRLLESRGLPVPPWTVWGGNGADPGASGSAGGGGPGSRDGVGAGDLGPLPGWDLFPAIVKPAAEDGSVGITQEAVVADARALARRLAQVAPRAPLLVQAFVGTREVNVGMVGDEPLPLAEIVFHDLPPGFHPLVGYEAKWSPGSPEDRGTRPVCPAPLPSAVAEEARALAREAWEAVGGRGYGRVDLRLTEPGTLHLLEVNPNPDLAPSAGLARMARARGWSYSDLVGRIVEEAAS